MARVLSVTPSSFELEQIFNDEDFRDSIGGMWVSGRNGNRWRLILTFNNLSGADRRALWADVAALRGKRDTLEVEWGPHLGWSRAGAGNVSGTPQTVGAVTAGATQVTVDGCDNDALWLAAGDFISINAAVKLVTDDVTTTGGSGTINFWPETHLDYADNSNVAITNGSGGVQGHFYLIEAQGLGGVPHPSDDSGTPWRTPTVTLVLEEDVDR